MSTVPAFAPPRGARPSRGSTDAFARARLAVVPRTRVRAGRMPFVTLVSVVLLGGIVGLLCFNTQMQQASFAETRLQSQADTLSAREQTLHDQVQQLRDPQHLAAAAQHAGMVIPETACTLTLGSLSGTGASAATVSDDCTAATSANTPPLEDPAPRKPASLDPAPQITVVQAPAADPAAAPAAVPAG